MEYDTTSDDPPSELVWSSDREEIEDYAYGIQEDYDVELIIDDTTQYYTPLEVSV